MISSHILEELGKVATTFGIIEKGRLILELSQAQLKQQCEERVEIDPETQELDRIIMEEGEIDADEARFGTTVGGTLTQDTPLEDVYAEMVGSGVLLIFAGVFASVYSDEERKSGFLKNLTVGRSGKKYIFASKAPVLLLFCFLQSIL